MYKDDELQSAFERMTVHGLKHMGGEVEDLLAQLKRQDFAFHTIEAVGIDLPSASDWMREQIPYIVEVLMMSAIKMKQGEIRNVNGAAEVELDSNDIEAIAATIMLRGIALGIMLEHPDWGDDPELIEELRSLVVTTQ